MDHATAPHPIRLRPDTSGPKRQESARYIMFYGIAGLLIILWLLGFSVFHIAGSLIHLVLVIALAMFVVGLLRGKQP